MLRTSHVRALIPCRPSLQATSCSRGANRRSASPPAYENNHGRSPLESRFLGAEAGNSCTLHRGAGHVSREPTDAGPELRSCYCPMPPGAPPRTRQTNFRERVLPWPTGPDRLLLSESRTPQPESHLPQVRLALVDERTGGRVRLSVARALALSRKTTGCSERVFFAGTRSSLRGIRRVRQPQVSAVQEAARYSFSPNRECVHTVRLQTLQPETAFRVPSLGPQ